MSGAVHTPGPWTVEPYSDGDSLVIHSDADSRVCFMATPGQLGSQEVIEANARLIAAAPDLLFALKAARREIVFHLRGNQTLVDASAAIFGIDAAIAKATQP